MIEVHYPAPDFQIRNDKSGKQIFDAIRKTWLHLTEEEWVRQNFVAYLVKELGYPSSLIAVEKELVLNGLKKRFDILVYNKEHQPWMLVECKAPQILLSEIVLQQALRYNITIPVLHIIITNGPNTIGWTKKNSNLKELAAMPLYPENH